MTLTKAEKRKAKRYQRKVRRWSNKGFYNSNKWRELRVDVMEQNRCRCMMCGRSPKNHKIVLHVDHIKPRSQYPELELDINNLQILCEDCNLGKVNYYQTDWRPELVEEMQETIDRLEAFIANHFI